MKYNAYKIIVRKLIHYSILNQLSRLTNSRECDHISDIVIVMNDIKIGETSDSDRLR